MESAFPKPTLLVALCISICSLAANLTASYKDVHRSQRLLLRRQIIYSAVEFCSILTALLITEFSKLNVSAKLPLAWCFLSVLFSEADQRHLQIKDFSQARLYLYPLSSYIRPLPLFYAVVPSHYYSLFTFVPIINEFSVSCYECAILRHALHRYRCLTIVLLMSAFFIASMVSAFRDAHLSELVLGIALDVLLLLTLPLEVLWSERIWAWLKEFLRWSRKIMVRQTLDSGARMDSEEELHRIDFGKSFDGPPLEVESATASRNDLKSQQLDDEQRIGTAM